jgi:hypothetical protein
MLDDLLAGVRERLRALYSNETVCPPGCLTFSRARLLSLEPDRTTVEERSHLEACHRCAQLLQTFAREMPHLSLWTLVRRHLGVIEEREQQAVAYHLEQGACRCCRQRADTLRGASDRLLQLSGPLVLPHPTAVAAATAQSHARARSRDGSLETELVQEGHQLTLELRTRNAALNHHLVGYSLRSGPRQREGFTVLRPDVEGWFTAETTFESRDLYTALGGRCEELLVLPAVEEVLGSSERDALLASAARDRTDVKARAAWTAWLAEAARRGEAFPPAAQRLLGEVGEVLSQSGS